MTRYGFFNKATQVLLNVFVSISCQSLCAETQEAVAKPVTANLLCAKNKIKANDVLWVLVDFKISPGWYLCWDSKENAGKAPQIQLNVPQGFMKGDIFWPTPKKITSNGATFWGYENSLSIPVQLQAAPDLQEGQDVKITCDLKWVAVGKSSVPGNAQLSLSLPVSPEPADLDQKIVSLFQDSESHMHRQGDSYQITSKGKVLTIALTRKTQRFQDTGEIYFVPETESLFEKTTPISYTEENDSKKLIVNFSLKKPISNKQDTRIRGILVVVRKGDYNGENQETWWIDSVI